ncbi:DUF7225 domain-containing protein [Fimbriiglobus ruber]|uniref:DUF7225 domain-containing protein n=1 Tax=Fimbriiglobus ruber TaxID=1908690 RepID=A0A225DEW3_9BACT|nr:hypothetical protein [Fimbriiglobus ruber]OWK35876.1 hypothetical protein FRUB_08439 [Fimbriiglobus ruber]
MAKSLDIPGTCDRVGRRLQVEYGNKPIPAAVLIETIAAECGCPPDSVFLTDHCYNRITNSVRLGHSPVFIYEGPGLFRHVGLGYPYTGPLHHKPKGKGEPKRVVGQWTTGQLKYTYSG